MTTFCAFMAKREKAISQGKMGHDRSALSVYNTKNQLNCHYVAKEQAEADTSDPFTYSRAMSHMLNGTNRRGDYEVEFHKEVAWSEMDPKAKIEVKRPRKRKVPCL